MKKISRRTILKGAGLFSLAVAMKPLRVLALHVEGFYRFGIQGKADTRFVLETLSALPHRSIYLNTPKRIVIDLKTSSDLELKPQTGPLGVVKNIRFGRLNSEFFRIVLDLKRPALLSKAFVLNPIGGSGYRHVFDITTTAEKTFLAKVDKVTAVTTATTTAAKPAEPTPIPVAKRPKKTPVIVLDPGHGGKDPGAIGRNRTLEKNIVLSVGKKLEAILKKKGYKVYMTRRTDKYLKLADRARFGEKKHADLFLSIHADSNPVRSARGLSVYTLSEKATDEEAAKLAKRENAADLIGISGFEHYDKNTQFILGQFGQDLAVQEAIIFAELIVSAVKKTGIKYLKRTHRSAPFSVLRSTVPSALAELGFLSNPTEEKLLRQASHQNKLANLIAKAISKYSFS